MTLSASLLISLATARDVCLLDLGPLGLLFVEVLLH